jgi:hypothetical protein
MSAIREITLQPFSLTQPSQVKIVYVTLMSASKQQNEHTLAQKLRRREKETYENRLSIAHH